MEPSLPINKLFIFYICNHVQLKKSFDSVRFFKEINIKFMSDTLD